MEHSDQDHAARPRFWRRLVGRSGNAKRPNGNYSVESSTQAYRVDDGRTRSSIVAADPVSNVIAASPLVSHVGRDEGLDMWAMAERRMRQDADLCKCLERYDAALEEQYGARLEPIGTQDRRKQMFEYVVLKVEQLQNRKDKTQSLERPLRWILKTKDLVNAAAQPCLPASIACAGVMMFLTASVQAVNERDDFLEGMNSLAESIHRLAQYESLLWKKGGSQPDQEVVDLLVNACFTVFSFQARAACYLEGSVLKRGVHNVFQVDGWKDLLAKIDKADAKVMAWAQIQGLKDTQKILDHVVSQQTDGFGVRQRQFMAALYASAYPYEDGLKRNRRPVQGTCQWFVTHDHFKAWSSRLPQAGERSALLYLTADPGCGKSVLSRYLVEDILSGKERSVCHAFFKDDFADQKSAINVTCALLHQILLSNRRILNTRTSTAMRAFESQGPLFFQSFAALWKELENAASSQETICVIDALDECRESDRAQVIRAVATTCTPTLKILLTSRPYDHIRREVYLHYGEGVQSIHLRGDRGSEADAIAREISMVIESRVTEVARLHNFSAHERDLMASQLQSVENRTYLWVTLVFDGLITQRRAVTKRDILGICNRLPGGAYDAYEKILAKSPDREKTRRILQVVLGAARPLNLSEMSVALELDGIRDWNEIADDIIPEGRMRDSIKDLCGLFVMIVDDRVYFLHQTAREFLLCPAHHTPAGATRDITLWQHSLSANESNLVLAQTCMSALQERNFRESRELFQYSAERWVHHYHRLSESDAKSMAPAARDLCCQSASRVPWFFILDRICDYKTWPVKNPLCVAAHLGLVEVFKHMLQVEDSINVALRQKIDAADSFANDAVEYTPLGWASQNGHARVVEVLLGTKDVNVEFRSRFGSTSLEMAVQNGHLEVVDLLIRVGNADVNHASRVETSAFWRAAAQDDRKMMKLILDTQRFHVGLGSDGETALMRAASRDNLPAVKLLLERGGADVNATTLNGQTVIHQLVDWPTRLDMAKVLIDTYKAHADHPDDKGVTALMQAAAYGSASMVRLLLSRGARPDRADRDGCTPLWYAAGGDRASEYDAEWYENGVVYENEALRILLERCNDQIDQVTSSGSTPIARAIQRNKRANVRFLLEHHARLDIADDQGRTPLRLSLRNPQITAMMLQVERAMVDSIDADGRSAIWYAVRDGSPESLELLLATSKAKINHQDKEGRPPLSLAVELGYVDKVKVLLMAGAQVSLCDTMNRTPLWYARKRADKGIITPPDTGTRVPMIIIEDIGDEEIVQLLLAAGGV